MLLCPAQTFHLFYIALQVTYLQVQNKTNLSLSLESKDLLRDLLLYKTSWGFVSFHLYCSVRYSHANSIFECVIVSDLAGVCVLVVEVCEPDGGCGEKQDSEGSRNCHTLLHTLQRLLKLPSPFSSFFSSVPCPQSPFSSRLFPRPRSSLSHHCR